MVKKLFKHEFLSYIRVMSVVYIILLTMAAAGRVIQFFASDSIPYKIISVFSGITYGISVFAAFAFVFVLGIVRFYKNLFTGEGYLSFTLPVTPAQHILVKAVTTVAMEAVTVLVVLLSGCIIFAGEVLVEIWKAAAYIFEKLYEFIGFQSVLICGEFVILFLLGCFSGILMYYVFISIGQMFKKNRILAAVGAYFAYYIVTQILSTIFIVVISILGETGVLDAFLERLGRFAEVHPFVAIHSGMGIIALVTAVFIFVEFVVVKKIITKKLNLE